MTEVFINNNRLFPDLDKQTLKLTLENPFYENSGSYTLDVNFPLSIPENVRFFGNMNRLDVSKGTATYDAMIIVENRILFKGTATTTKVSSNTVTLQFLAGNSRVWFWSRYSSMYIDEIDYVFHEWKPESIQLPFDFIGGAWCFRNFIGVEGEWTAMPVVMTGDSEYTANDWTAVHVTRNNPRKEETCVQVPLSCDACQPNLLYILEQIIKRVGYVLKDNILADTFAEHIYIATGNTSKDVYSGKVDWTKPTRGILKMALPHWTVEEFIKEFQRFLNVVLVFNDVEGSVKIVRDATQGEVVDITQEVIKDYEVDIIKDEDAKANIYDSNIKYTSGNSEHHVLDMPDEDILDGYETMECESYERLLEEYNKAPLEKRGKVIWACPSGYFITSYDEEGNETGLVQMNQFGKLIRSKDSEDVELKIIPCGTTSDYGVRVDTYIDGVGLTDIKLDQGATTKLIMVSQTAEEAKPSVYDALTSKESDEGLAEKDDFMQVFFVDDKSYEITADGKKLLYPEPFTDYRLNAVENHDLIHERWSLALSHSDASESVGKLHELSREQNQNAEHRFDFFSSTVPDPMAIYVVANKRYVCKKLEVRFKSLGMDRVVTGYFEEIL